jgi:hypothetical protein
MKLDRYPYSITLRLVYSLEIACVFILIIHGL